jgi:hypothetical protein
MNTDIRCPGCNGGDLSTAGAGLRHCPRCGATLVYRFQWAPLLGLAVLGVLLGLGSGLLFAGKAAFMIGPLVALAAFTMRSRFRALQKV